MGLFDYVTDLYASLSVQAVEAEGPVADKSGEQSSGQDENAEEAQANKQDATSDDDSASEEDAEEEEEEEEEPEDIKPKLEEECLKSAQCAPAKHHYDECAERVTKQQEENGKADEDCVEEFFHMMHCATQCAAPKLFAALR